MISDSPPHEYYPKYSKRFSGAEMERMCYWHALPGDWAEMSYKDFLVARRELITRVMRDGYERLAQGESLMDRPRSLEEVVANGENVTTEFKATLRVNLHTQEKDPRMEHAILKTLDAFLNSHGGTLFIGVDNDGNAIGLDADGFADEDKLDLHLGNLVKSRLGAAALPHIVPGFKDLHGRRVLAVECQASKVPVYLKDGKEEEFYVRVGASSASLPPSQMTEYIQQRFQ